MQYRTLGKTGLSLSVLGFGSSPLGGVFGDVGEADAVRTVHRAIELGINYFDVAPYYGITKAESVLGVCLSGIPREQYFLSTKVGRYGSADFDFSAERVTRSVDESLSRLGLEYVDILLCHDIEYVPMAQIWEETLPALAKVVQTGKARFLGFSGLPLAIYPRVLEQTDLVDVVLSYCHYTIQDTSLDTLLPYLTARNLGIINAAPLGMGLLSEREPPAWHPAPAEVKDACRKAAEYCAITGVSLSDLALSFSVQRPDIATTLVGMGSVGEVERNVASVERVPDPALLAQVRNILAPVRDLAWLSGLPENQR